MISSNSHTALSVAAGILASAVFMLGLNQAGGIITLFCPLLLFFLVAFHSGFQAAIVMSIVSFVGTLLITGGSMEAVAVLILLELFPGLLLIQPILKGSPFYQRGEHSFLGPAIAHVAIYVCVIYGLLAMHYSSGDGLEAAIQDGLATFISQLESPMREDVTAFFAKWPYLVLAAWGWIWAFGVYAIAALAYFLLIGRSKNLPRTIGVEPFRIPLWILGLLIGSALFSFAGSTELMFICRVFFLLLLIPYFLAGSMEVHAYTRSWQGRKLWLFIYYGLMITQYWLILFAASYGIFKQIKDLTTPAPRS